MSVTKPDSGGGAMHAPLAPFFELSDIHAALRECHVDVGVHVDGESPPECVKVWFKRWDYPQESMIVVSVRLWQYKCAIMLMDVTDNLIFSQIKYVVPVAPLSQENQCAWRHHAELFGMPPVLYDVARLTEFALALMSPLISRTHVDATCPGLFVTEQRDGKTYYGNGLEVMFPFAFANN